MRRREKFVLSAILLSLALLGTQYLPAEWRYLGIGLFFALTFVISAWSLAEDLQLHEWLTIVPFPAFYAAAVSLFYFLLPELFLSRLLVLVLFGVGMYALLLTANIFSVAKGRTIQLLYAAHAVGLFFTMLTSILLSNVILSLRLPFYFNAALVYAVHWPLVLMSLWSVELQPRIGKEILLYSSLLSLVLAELAAFFSFLPMQVWHKSLFIMSALYIALSVLHNFIKGRLFRNTINEYILVAVLMLVLFVLMFPLK